MDRKILCLAARAVSQLILAPRPRDFAERTNIIVIFHWHTLKIYALWSFSRRSTTVIVGAAVEIVVLHIIFDCDEVRCRASSGPGQSIQGS
jgi:hypothetical protein